jgi:hypothetical protein
MKKILSLIIVAVSLFATAQTTDKSVQRKALTPEERMARRAYARKMMAQKVGGFLSRPGTPQGEIFYVNCQKRIPKEWIDESIRYFTEETKFKISYKEGTFQMPSPEIAGNASLFIIDDENLPAILLAPENAWAFVNVAVIAKEKRPVFFEMRTKKQMSRAFALLCGASNSQYPRALTRGIIDEKDLDKNPDLRLPVDVLARFQTYMEPLGVKANALVPYRRAVEEGWAPAPTNDIQRAIWDKVHAMPTAPIKIKPETKKVKE